MRPLFFLVALSALPLVLLPAFAGCGTELAAATTGAGEVTVDLPDGATVVVPPGSDGGISLFDGSIMSDDAPGGDANVDFCSGSGPVFSIPGANTACSGALGATTFLFAVCACGDIGISGDLITDSLPIDDGGSPGAGGSIGANGGVSTNSALQVNGSIWAQSTGEPTALSVKQPSTVVGDVHAGAAIQAEQPLTIDGNLFANGNITGAVSCYAAQLSSSVTDPGLEADGGVVRTPVNVVAPCDCTDILDVGAIVASAATKNNDSTASLTPTSFSPFPSMPVILPCGEYYFTGIGGAPVNLTIGGRVAIFVQGDFDGTNGVNLTLANGAQLDLFISGNLLLGNAALGSPDSPARVRIYVGGSDLTLSGTGTIGANIYAPNVAVALSTALTMAGSLFVGSLELAGTLTLHYDETILSTADCPPNKGQCSSCHDCYGATPACIGGSCAPCVTDSDCCAPLHCSQGQCYDEIP